MLKILIANSKLSMKFSHFIFWNILSCKNNYKKFCSLKYLRGFLLDIVNSGMSNEIDSAFNHYESFFMQYNSIDTFIDKSLIPVNEIYEYLSDEVKSNPNTKTVLITEKQETVTQPTQGSSISLFQKCLKRRRKMR